MTEAACYYCDSAVKSEFSLPICRVDGFGLHLARNQAHRGRVILAYDGHVGRLVDLEPARCAAFFLAVQKVARALDGLFGPRQINYGLFGDKVAHIHCHLVPKYEGGPDWGTTFQMSPQPPVILGEGDYAELVGTIAAAMK